MLNEKKWYAVYTRPRWEKKVSYLLNRQKIENYCPLNRVERQWSDREKIIFEPLFTSYVFVKLQDIDHLQVKQTDGVINFVHWLKKPAVIREEEIEIIKHFLNQTQSVKLEKVNISVNDQIKVLSGPLMERQGNVMEIRNRTLKVWLPSLGVNIIAEIEKTNVEILSFFAESNRAIAF